MTILALPVSAMELSDQVMSWQITPKTSKYEKLSDMDMLTDNEMDAVTGQHMVSVMLEAEDGGNSFEINVEFTTASFGGIIKFTEGDTIIDGKKYKPGFIVFMGPTGKTTEMLAELTATVPSGAIMEMEVKTTGSKGLDIGGTKAFEIPPFTTFARVSIPDIEYDIYVAEDMKIILDSMDDASSQNAKTLGILRLFDLDFDLSFPKESSIYIYPS
jgi:hypothetical protein